MKKRVFLGIVMLLVSLVSDYFLAYYFLSVIIGRLDPATINIVQFLYIFMCFLSAWLTLVSIAYIFGENLKTLLKYLGILISIGVAFGTFMGLLTATVNHQYYCGNVMVLTIMAWILCSTFGVILYKAYDDF